MPTNVAPMPLPTQPGAPPPTASVKPPPAPLPPLAAFGPPDPGGAATSIDIRHMLRAAPALNQLAATHMIKMQKEGPPFAGQFNEGQVLEHTFEVLPGRCYGVVAIAGGITELGLRIELGEPPVTAVLGKDEMKGPQAVVGPSGNCVRNTLPTPDEARVVMTAVAGAGTAVARVYSR